MNNEPFTRILACAAVAQANLSPLPPAQPFSAESNTFPAVFAFDCLALYADELLQARCRTPIPLPPMKPQTRKNLQGRALPKGAGGVAEDVLQMGGDFVVARDGR
jgi:hypothetical protein